MFSLSQTVALLLNCCQSSPGMPRCTHRTYHESVPFWHLVCGQELTLPRLRLPISMENGGTQADMGEMNLQSCWLNCPSSL